MAEKQPCLFQRTFVMILILSALIFLGHYVLDAYPIPTGSTVACRSGEIQQSSIYGSETSQTSLLHGGILLATLVEPNCPTILLYEGGLLTPECLVWAPPTPLRPPISS